jgi:F0F1-type ATP synthase assembly protein I
VPVLQSLEVMRNIGKYTGIAFEMIATIVLFVLLGRWIDAHWAWKFPLGTFFGAIVGVGMSLYVILKKF